MRNYEHMQVQEITHGTGEPRTELLTVQQLADQYGFAVATLYGWRHRGIGPASVRLGARVRYRRTDIEAWIEDSFQAEAKAS
jgi:predicted DNA-binding transcriptional regulator AlpA